MALPFKQPPHPLLIKLTFRHGRRVLILEAPQQLHSDHHPANYVESAVVASKTTVTTGTFIAAPFLTPVLDDFTATNNPLPSPPWVIRFSNTGGFKSTGGTATVFSNIQAIAFKQDTGILTDCEAYVTLTSMGTTNNKFLCARGQGSLASDDFHCYAVEYNLGSGFINIVMIDGAGSSFALHSLITNVFTTVSAGDKIGIRCYGTTIEAWLFHSGAWALVGSVVDTTYASGYLGLFNTATTTPGTYDDFGGGSITAFVETAQYVESATVTGVTSVLSAPNRVDGSLTMSGAIYNDTSRLAAVDGDGLNLDTGTGFWEGTTNLVQNGGAETNATGYNGNSAAVVRSTTKKKFGSASIQATPALGGPHEGPFYIDGVHGLAISAAHTYAVSLWAYSDVERTIHVGFDENNSSDVFVSSGSDDFHLPAGVWTRCEHVHTTAAGVAFAIPFAYTNDNAGGATPFYIDGLQFEDKGYCTPYVETNGGTASRGDSQTTFPVGTKLDETQGFAIFRFKPSYTTNEPVNQLYPLLEWADTNSNRLLMYIGNNNFLEFNRTGGGGSTTIIADMSAAVTGVGMTLAVKWDSGNIYLSVNGAPFNSIPNTDIPVIVGTTVGLGYAPVFFGAAGLAGELMWTLLGTGTPSDSDIAAVHANGDTDPEWWSTAPPAGTTFIWDGVDTDYWTLPFTTDTEQYVESATVTSITTVSAVESYQPGVSIQAPKLNALLIKLGLDKAHLFTNNLIIELPGVGTAYVDSATISSVTSVQSSDSTDFLDTAGSINGVSSITSTETVADVEAATVPGVTSLTSVENAQYVESATVASVTSLTAVETTDYVEAATVASVTSLTYDETYPTHPPSLRPLLALLGLGRTHLLRNNILNPADSVRVNYTESATISGVTSVQSSDSTDFLDTSGSINGVSSISTTENAQYVDGSIVSGSTTPSSTDTAQYVDAGTIASVTSLTYTETTDYVDTGTVSGVTTPSSVDTADYVESATVAGVTSIAYTEVYGTTTQAPRPVLITLTRRPLHLLFNSRLNPDDSVRVNYVESATISSVTSIQSSDSTDFIDTSGSINGTSSVTSTENAQYVDGVVVSGSTSLSSTDVAAYVDSATIPGVTSLTFTENAQYVDLNTCAGVTTLTYIETTDYVESATVSGVTTITYLDLYGTTGGHVQPLLITLAKGHLKVLTDHSRLGMPPAAIVYTDVATISGVTSITYTENEQATELNTISGTTTLTSSDVSSDSDNNTVGGVTSVPPADIYNGVDSSTLATKTTITFTESLQDTDTNTVASKTSVLSTDTAQYVDGSRVSSTTFVSAVEQYVPVLTIVECELFGTASRRWSGDGGTSSGRYTIIGSKRWSGDSLINHLLGTGAKRWMI